MALLGTIRNKFGWLMMGLIFVGIASFLFMDISPNGPATNATTVVGYVNDDKITQEMMRTYSDEYKGAGYLNEELQQEVWDRIVGEKLLMQKTNAAGIVVTPDEMGDMFLSNRPELLSPIVRRRFGDRQTNKVNTAGLREQMEIFKNTSLLLSRAKNEREEQELLEQQKQWFAIERSVKIERLQSKYFQAISAGFYTPSWMAEFENNLQNATYNVDYVRIPYTNIQGDINVTDEELKAYIAARPKQYDRKATASIEYVSFPVIPTAKDSAMYRQQMMEIANDFKNNTTIEEDSILAVSENGALDATYYTSTELTLPLGMADTVMNAKNGTVFGPYVDGQQYMVLKKIDSKLIPDSVRSRHILIRAQTPEEGQGAKTLLDSLKKVLEEDPSASFDSLALKYSTDGSRFQGGDLGWKAKDGSFVPQFEEYMFYTGKEGEYQLIYTQYGVHLIQITDTKFETNKRGVRVATAGIDIIPTEETTKKREREVNEFIANNRTLEEIKAAAREMGLNTAPANGLEKGSFNIDGIGKNSAAAEIIRWAHDKNTAAKEVARSYSEVENQQLNYTERLIVPALVSRSSAGLATLDNAEVRAEVERAVTNERKVALVQQAIQGAASLDAIAGQYNVTRESAASMSYSNGNIGVIGVEPKVAAIAARSQTGSISPAVGGKEGVYVIQVQSKTDASPIVDLKTARQTVTSRLSSMLSSGVYSDMKKNADIIDDRPDL